MQLRWIGIDTQEHFALFLIGQWPTYETFYKADCGIAGGSIYVLRDGEIVFRFDSDQVWMRYCAQRVKRDPTFAAHDVNYRKWCSLIERWVRYCIHKGASSWQPADPNPLRELEPSEDIGYRAIEFSSSLTLNRLCSSNSWLRAGSGQNCP